MSGRTIFRNIMSILSLGTNSIIHDRSSKTYGHILEKAVHLSLEIVILVFEKDLLVAGSWRPLYQVVTLIVVMLYMYLINIHSCY